MILTIITYNNDPDIVSLLEYTKTDNTKEIGIRTDGSVYCTDNTEWMEMADEMRTL